MVLNRVLIFLPRFGAASLRNAFVSNCTCFSIAHTELNIWLKGGFDLNVFRIATTTTTTPFNVPSGVYSNGIKIFFQKTYYHQLLISNNFQRRILGFNSLLNIACDISVNLN
jgi:hypothetical protein